MAPSFNCAFLINTLKYTKMHNDTPTHPKTITSDKSLLIVLFFTLTASVHKISEGSGAFLIFNL